MNERCSSVRNGGMVVGGVDMLRTARTATVQHFVECMMRQGSAIGTSSTRERQCSRCRCTIGERIEEFDEKSS